MRSSVLPRVSAATGGTAAVLTAVAHLTNIPLDIPEHQLRLAWTLARILLQL